VYVCVTHQGDEPQVEHRHLQLDQDQNDDETEARRPEVNVVQRVELPVDPTSKKCDVSGNKLMFFFEVVVV